MMGKEATLLGFGIGDLSEEFEGESTRKAPLEIPWKFQGN